MRVVLLVAIAAGGCGFEHGAMSDGGNGSNTVDGAVDAPPDVPAGTTCFGSGVVRVCTADPTSDVRITANTTIDTGTSNRCATLLTGSNIDACVLVGTSVTIDPSVKLTGTGTRPLVIVSTSSTTIAGTIDVASHRIGISSAPSVGAGGDSSVCVAGAAPTFNNSGGGGYGGSFGGIGGTGGNGEQGNGGVPSAAITTVTALRGGCPGSAGAMGVLAGEPGHGGGAVYLIAATTITIGGTINASGSGGGGGTGGDAGGGGGGSGGMIGLEAPTVTVTGTGKVFANGGGGGEGNETFNGNPGGDPAAPTPAAGGGSLGTGNGGDGGNGSQNAAGADGKNGNNSGGGGGGGGGGAGVILVVPSMNLGGSVMPPER